MARSRAHQRFLIVVASALAVGCGASAGSGPGSGDEPADEPAGTGPAATSPAGVEFSGVVSVSAVPGAPTRLEIHDPGDLDAPPRATVPLPDAPSSTWSRSSFSADWQYAAWGDDPIRVARFDPAVGEYAELVTIDAVAGGYSGDDLTYGGVAFAPEGTTLWAEVRRGDDTTLGSLDVAVLEADEQVTAGDLTDAGFALSGDDDPGWRFGSTGEPVMTTADTRVAVGAGGDTTGRPGDWRAEFWLDESGAVVDPAVSVWGESNVEATYTEELRLGPAEFVLVAHAPTEIGFDDGADAAREFGVVAHVTIDAGADDVTLRQLVPVGGEDQLALWAVAAPDRTQALLCIASPQFPDTGTAYLADLSGGAEPGPAGDCGRTTEPLGWS